MIRRFISCLMMVAIAALPLGGMATDVPMDGDSQAGMEMPCHSQDTQKSDSQGERNSCQGAHACCLAFMAPADLSVDVAPVHAVRIASGHFFTAGFVLAPLDPPPLAL
ncbi:MAG TPA: hypothetical protein VM140_07440 [Burkholderiales bacterium]|nr:hypothetical protein [Burkholderiales bacterium]